MTNLTAKQIEQINRINILMIELGFGEIIDDLITNANASATQGTPVNAVNATDVLTVSGVVIDGETFTVNGVDIYEFCADAAQSVTTVGNIPVDITASVTGSVGTLTVDTQPISGDTMTIGTKVFTFVPVGTANADGEISIATDLASAKLAIVEAINGTDGWNVACDVSAADFATNDCVLTALVGGTAGDAIATTETFDEATNVFAAATLGSGADCTAANAITALVLAITTSDTQGVGAADGAGDTIDLTADVAGTIGNTITVAETMANATLAAATLLGGIDGTVGVLGQTYIDANYLYKCIADNTVADKNWRSIPLSPDASVATPVNAVAATNILTVSGVVIDGETFTVNGVDIYEFCADTAQSVTTAGNIPVDITASVTGSVGTLTVDTQPTAGDTMTIGTKDYTFVPAGTDNADGEISIGTDLASAKLAIVAAINATDGHNVLGVVSAAAFATDDCVITALVGGTAGDAIASTETFTAATNVFAAATLGSGADCTAANAITALVLAITTSDTQGVGAADGAGDTIDLTADVAGVLANAITIEEDMANGSLASVTLAGGVDGTVGIFNQTHLDDTYLYKCIATNTIVDSNWRRISLGSAY